MRRSGGIRQRVHPRWLRQRRQPTVLEDGYSPWWVLAPSQHGRSTQDTAPVLQSSDKVGNLGDEFGILEDGRCTDAEVFQRRYLVHELVFACSPLPPPRLQVSHTILTRADWCAVRAVARCEMGLLPVITSVEAGSECFGTDWSL